MEDLVDSIAVLQPPANVTGIAMKINERWNGVALLLGMTNEIRVEGNFVAGLYVHSFKRQPVDLRRWHALPMRSDVGVEQQVVLDRVEEP